MRPFNQNRDMHFCPSQIGCLSVGMCVAVLVARLHVTTLIYQNRLDGDGFGGYAWLSHGCFLGLRFRRATTYVFFRQITLSRRSSIDDDEMCDRESNCRIVIWSTVSHVTNGRQDANFRRQRLSANLFDKGQPKCSGCQRSSAL